MRTLTHTPKTTYAVRFDFPEGIAYAGLDRGAAAFAPSLATAELYDDPDRALGMLMNAYGSWTRQWGRVVTVHG